MPTYSFGEDSPLKFQISDKLAERYNKAVERFFKAQVRFNQKFGRPWDPMLDPIKVQWTRSEKKAWNEFARVYATTVKALERNDGPLHPNDIMDDFLVKNAASTVAALSAAAGRLITLAAFSGVVYGLRRGL